MKEMKPIIQIAGIAGIEEAEMIVEAGATHLGFPFRLPVNKEDISEHEAGRIIRNLPDTVKAVLITYLDRADEIVALMHTLGCGIVQLHGSISIDQLLALRRIKPGIEIWKSLVINPDNFDNIFISLKVLQPFADVFITDTFDPVSGASGATGKTHDWNISSRIVSLSKKPVIVAGGLNPDNVEAAVKQTNAAGVDVHTGVEGMDGYKKRELVEAFVENAMRAYKTIS